MRVLLVEDTVGLGEAVRDQITDNGHALDWVQTLRFAEASVQTTAYDLILLDLMLPDGHGLGFLRKLRST
jgi:two-component system OmpR family response regulator